LSPEEAGDLNGVAAVGVDAVAGFARDEGGGEHEAVVPGLQAVGKLVDVGVARADAAEGGDVGATVIEIPGAGKLTPQELRALSQTSCGVLTEMGPQIQPANRISRISSVIDPTTAE
jgi:hypothetical protein